MWTKATRAQHNRNGLRCASNLTDAERAVLEPLLPPRSPLERPPTWPMRTIDGAIFYVLRGGVPWRMLPSCFLLRPTVYGWFAACREQSGREASPTRAVIDSQSVKMTEVGGPRGYGAGKKVQGRERRAMVDTDGRLLVIQVGPASVQDRDGAVSLLPASRRSFPFVEQAFADSAYAGQRVERATRIGIEIVHKPRDQVGFAVHPRRWMVESCFWPRASIPRPSSSLTGRTNSLTWPRCRHRQSAGPSSPPAPGPSRSSMTRTWKTSTTTMSMRCSSPRGFIWRPSTALPHFTRRTGTSWRQASPTTWTGCANSLLRTTPLGCAAST